MKPQGSLKCFEAFERTVEHSAALSNSLVLAGFSNQSVATHENIVVVSATKPNYTTGASQPIKLKKKTVSADPWASPAPAGGSVALIDENSLLTEADLAKPVVKTDDCEVGSTKKACKNCSCGRADEEASASKPKLTLDMIENPAVNSSCGSCGLGDAFRCGGCPYRGLPSFKPGERIVLPSDFDMDLIES